METQFYGDGQHNGGVYNSGNLNPYIYCYQNPIRYLDPNGKQTDAVEALLEEVFYAASAAYIASEASSQVHKPSTPGSITISLPKLHREVVYPDPVERLRNERYPAAKKDKLTIRTFPATNKQKLTILSSNKADFGNAKKRTLNNKLEEIDGGNANGHLYANDGRENSEILPKKGKNGDISYSTYDLYPPPSGEQRANGATRDKTRIVVGNDGSAYITNQHYQKGSFKKIR